MKKTRGYSEYQNTQQLNIAAWKATMFNIKIIKQYLYHQVLCNRKLCKDQNSRSFSLGNPGISIYRRDPEGKW